MDDEARPSTGIDLGTFDDAEDACRMRLFVGSLLGSSPDAGERNARSVVVFRCTIGAQVVIDVRLIDALARLALAVEQAGSTLVVSNPSESLARLIRFVGLAASFGVSPLLGEEERCVENLERTRVGDIVNPHDDL